MLLHLNESKIPMKLVYQLSEELKADPQQIALAQALTLDFLRPTLGLKGTYGLFGSSQWWKNITDGIMPLKKISGVVQRVYVSGQDESDGENAFEILLSDGSCLNESFYFNNAEDCQLFKPGHQVEIVYALDDLKSQSTQGGEAGVSEIVLEMAISEVPLHSAD